MIEWVVTGLIGGAVGAVVGHFAVDWMHQRRMRQLTSQVEDLEAEVFQLQQRYRSMKGVAAREEQDSELEAALADPEVVKIITSEEFKNAGIWDKLKLGGALVIKHPVLARMLWKHGGKLLKG